MLDLYLLLQRAWQLAWLLSIINVAAHYLFFFSTIMFEFVIHKESIIVSPSAIIDAALLSAQPTADNDADEKCPICHDELVRPVKLISCEHIFCDICIRTTLTGRDTCPLDMSEPFRRLRIAWRSKADFGLVPTAIVTAGVAIAGLASYYLSTLGSEWAAVFSLALGVLEKFGHLVQLSFMAYVCHDVWGTLMTRWPEIGILGNALAVAFLEKGFLRYPAVAASLFWAVPYGIGWFIELLWHRAN